MSSSGSVEIHALRVRNGFGITTSAFSPSCIGLYDASSAKRQALNARAEKEYTKDADFQLEHLKGRNPVRKVLHMQKCFPHTVRRLDKEGQLARGGGAVCAAKGPRPRQAPGKDMASGTEAGASADGSTKSAERNRERTFSKGKMEYNRERGRRADVHRIITGEAKLEGKPPLFPVNATHQQLLGVMRAVPEDPEAAAPPVPRTQKWLGDSLGWEGKEVHNC